MAVIDQGQKLQRQLELQARMLGVETDQIKLTQSILQTCVALLNITDNVMPENIPAFICRQTISLHRTWILCAMSCWRPVFSL